MHYQNHSEIVTYEAQAYLTATLQKPFIFLRPKTQIVRVMVL